MEILKAGEIKIDSALNHNTVGAGTGIITKNVTMIVTEDKTSGKRGNVSHGRPGVQGGFTGWGLYTPEIADNLRYLRDEVFSVLREMVKKRGGLAIKPILAEALQMGDEHHTRQSAADLIFLDQIIMNMLEMDIPRESLRKAMDYVVNTPRFFHPFGQGALRASMLAARDIPYSTMVTAVCGNAVEFGIKVSGLGEEWFTAPAPMMKGKYTSSKYTEKDQLPWLGDSCIVECAGVGGFAAATSPIVCNLRGMKLKEAIALTREMEQISIAKNHNYPIPNLDFDFLPVGIDIRKVLKTGISPALHGGMFSLEGGLLGAGSARVPMQCFEKAIKAFAEKY